MINQSIPPIDRPDLPGGPLIGRHYPIVLAAAYLVLAASFAASVHAFWETINDDAYITFRYAAMLAAGKGPYFNPGEFVEGYTNFSLMVLVAGIIRLFGVAAAPLGAKLIGAISCMVCHVLVILLSRNLFRDSIGVRAAHLGGVFLATALASHAGFMLNSFTGLETALFAALLTAGVWAGLREVETGRWHGAALYFAGLVLTRPEGPAYFACFWLILNLARWRWPDQRQRSNLALVVVVFAAHLSFRLLVYEGEWLPNTFYAKTGGFAGVAPITYVSSFLNFTAGRWWLATALVAATLLPWPLLGRLLPLLGCTLLCCLLPLATGSDWMLGWRFLVPGLPLLLLAFASAIVRLALYTGRWRPIVAIAGMAAFTTGNLYAQSGWGRAIVQYTQTRNVGYVNGHFALAHWLAQQACQRQPPMIALTDIGIIGFINLNYTILDVSGLTDRTIAKSSGRFLEKETPPDYILSQKPCWIVIEMQFAPATTGPTGELKTFDHNKGILASPAFREWYVERESTTHPRQADQMAVAHKAGAYTVFTHDHPGNPYFLTVFRRQTADKSGDPTADE